MGHRSNDAAEKGVTALQRKEECVLSMGQFSNDAAVKDVKI